MDTRSLKHTRIDDHAGGFICSVCADPWPCDSATIDWLEAVSVLPIEIDNFGDGDNEWPCFLTIRDGWPAGFNGKDDPGQRDTRYQAVGLRAVLRAAMAAYENRVVVVRRDNATLGDLPTAVRTAVEERLKREEGNG